MRKLLKHRNARRYLIGQSFSLFGDTAMFLAMGIWVKVLTGSNGEAGLVFFAFGVAALLSPLAGMVVDRLPRRPLLFWSNLGGGGVVLLLLLVHGRGQLWLIYAVAFLYGLAYTFLSAGQSALLKLMLPDELLGDARGMLSTVREGLRLFGPLTGAGLFALAGGGVVAIVDAATFVIAAGSLLLVRVEEAKAEPEDVHWFVEVTAGIRHIWSSIVLRQMIIAGGITLLVVGFSESICFAVVSDGLHRPPTFLGVVIAVQGVGAILGGPTAAPLARRIGEGPLMGLGLILVAAGAGLFAIPALAGVMPGAILFGVGIPWIVVGAYTMLQRLTPLELQGRVSAAADTVLSTPQVLSIAVGAWLIGIVNYRILLAVMSGTVLVAAAYLLSRKEQWVKLPSLAAELVVEPVASAAVEPAAELVVKPVASAAVEPVASAAGPRVPGAHGAPPLPGLRGRIGKHRSSSLPRA
ncbi:MAG TPA: MFS transporter [Acidimicrobiales bacterium]|nr:MFS transporter [Acidimicrobiales bacterium]